MEQTPQTTIATAPRKTGEALSVRRLFTKPGVHPFDEVECEIRDARIGHGDRVAFEQKGVEFHKSWSQNSTNTVPNISFCVQPDLPTRCPSANHIAGRVAGTISDCCPELSYFTSI